MAGGKTADVAFLAPVSIINIEVSPDDVHPSVLCLAVNNDKAYCFPDGEGVGGFYAGIGLPALDASFVVDAPRHERYTACLWDGGCESLP